MKRWICVLILLFAMTVPVRAAELPEELTEALPEGAEALLEDAGPFDDIAGFADGMGKILTHVQGQAKNVLNQQVRGAASVLLVVVLCGAVESLGRSAGKGGGTLLPMVGGMSIVLLTAGSMDSLIGLGTQTIGELQRFSKVLLPTLAAATAACGGLTTATFQQVTTVFLVDLLLNLIDGLLIPLTYLYIGVLTASACLSEDRLSAVAEGLKKVITWILTTALLAFTVYLSVARVITGSVDGAKVRVAKSAIAGVVPVVGGIVAEVSETVLAGAGLLKSTIGVFGMLAILAACAYPFLQLGVQYLLYKGTAVLSSAVGAPALCKLINGLGGVFGLVLGMTGACAMLLLVSVLSCVAAVMP